MLFFAASFPSLCGAPSSPSALPLLLQIGCCFQEALLRSEDPSSATANRFPQRLLALLLQLGTSWWGPKHFVCVYPRLAYASTLWLVVEEREKGRFPEPIGDFLLRMAEVRLDDTRSLFRDSLSLARESLGEKHDTSLWCQSLVAHGEKRKGHLTEALKGYQVRALPGARAHTSCPLLLYSSLPSSGLLSVLPRSSSNCPRVASGPAAGRRQERSWTWPNACWRRTLSWKVRGGSGGKAGRLGREKVWGSMGGL